MASQMEIDGAQSENSATTGLETELRSDKVIAEITKTLVESQLSSVLHTKWSDLASHLGVSPLSIEGWRVAMLVGTKTMQDVIKAILTEWTNEDGAARTVGHLVSKLRELKMNAFADMITEQFQLR